MESLSARELGEQLRNTASAEEFTRVHDAVQFGLARRMNMDVLDAFGAYAVRVFQELEIQQKVKIAELYTAYNTAVHGDMAVLQIAQQLARDVQWSLLLALLERETVSVKAVKSVIPWAQLVGCAQDDNVAKAIEALFLPQYCGADAVRTAVSLLSLGYSAVVEKCLLVMPAFGARQSVCQRLLQQLNSQSPMLVQHCVAQALKMRSAVQFKNLLQYFTAIPEAFTQGIAQSASAEAPHVRRNAACALEKMFPTTQNALEIQAQIQTLLQLLQDTVPSVRQAALQAVYVIIREYFSTLPSLQGLFDQIVLLAFDSSQGVRTKALDVLLLLAEEKELKKPIARSVAVNCVSFQQLLSADRKTKGLAVRMFCLAQQEREAISEDLSRRVLKELAELRDPQSLFLNGLKSFAEEPEFCYNQVYVGSSMCPQLLDRCLREYVDQVGLEVLFASESVTLCKSTEYKEDTAELVQDLLGEEDLGPYAALGNVLCSVVQKAPEKAQSLGVYLLQILRVLAWLSEVEGISTNLKTRAKEAVQFASQGLTREFQEATRALPGAFGASFRRGLNEVLRMLKKKQAFQDTDPVTLDDFDANTLRGIACTWECVANAGIQVLMVEQKRAFAEQIQQLNKKDRFLMEIATKDIQEYTQILAAKADQAAQSVSQIDVLGLLIYKLRQPELCQTSLATIIACLDLSPENSATTLSIQLICDLAASGAIDTDTLSVIQQKLDHQTPRNAAERLFLLRFQKKATDDTGPELRDFLARSTARMSQVGVEEVSEESEG